MRANLTLIIEAIFVFEWLVRIAAIFIVPRNRRPSAANGWLLFIMFFPTIGLLIYLLIGSPKLSRRRRAMQQKMDGVISEAVSQARFHPTHGRAIHFDVAERYQPFANLCANLGGMPAFSGNTVEILPEYDACLERITEDIRQAERFVHIEFFIIAYDETTAPMFTAMAEAVQRGVTVRVLFDTVGSRRYKGYRRMTRFLAENGIQWHAMLPLRLPGRSYTRPDLRNHRKIVVVDGSIGYTGSLNIVDRSYHRRDSIYYDELMARTVGPVTSQLHAAFISDWYAESLELLSLGDHPELILDPPQTGNVLAQVLPSGPSYPDDNNLKLFTSLIHAARTKVVITNPYVVPEDSLMTALTTAAQRGVEVTIYNSEVMDQWMVGHAQRSFYDELLAAGVKIYWYYKPVLLHAKHMTIDDDIAVIGSSNLDIRSFQLDLEVTLVVYDKAVVSRLRRVESLNHGKSRLVDKGAWSRRPLRHKLLDNVARLTAALQ